MEEHVSLHESRVEISMKKKKSEVAQSCPTLCDPMDTRLLCPRYFLGKSTGVGCHFLLQEMSKGLVNSLTDFLDPAGSTVDLHF